LDEAVGLNAGIMARGHRENVLGTWAAAAVVIAIASLDRIVLQREAVSKAPDRKVI
jgi:hypothetical protein